VDRLLARTPAAVTLLITSRVKLLIAAEREFHLAPLPTAAGVREPEALLAVPSIALFVDRAQIVRPDFQVTERTGETVAALCDRLEGIPLAIELAAARVQVMSPAQILEQVGKGRLDSLAARRRGAQQTERHRTLRAALDWSYELLTPDEQTFLAELSVFRGGWDSEGTRPICPTAEGGDVLELLMGLRDASLIAVADEDEGVRFSMLETVREYAAERLEASGGREAVCGRHARYLLRLAETMHAMVGTPEQGAAALRAVREIDNLRAALEWAKENGEDELRAGLVLGFWGYLNAQGYAGDTRRWFEDLIATETRLPPRSRARVLHRLADLTGNQGEGEKAAALLEECHTLFLACGDVADAADVLGRIGDGLVHRDLAKAVAYYERSLDLSRRTGDERVIASTRNHLI